MHEVFLGVDVVDVDSFLDRIVLQDSEVLEVGLCIRLGDFLCVLVLGLGVRDLRARQLWVEFFVEVSYEFGHHIRVSLDNQLYNFRDKRSYV